MGGAPKSKAAGKAGTAGASKITRTNTAGAFYLQGKNHTFAADKRFFVRQKAPALSQPPQGLMF